jgi:hypothetical protein
VSAPPEYLDRLRVVLVEAAEGRRRRRAATAVRRLAAVTAVAVVALAIATAVELRTAEPAGAGVEVTHAGGDITVRLTDLEHRPAVIERALREAGIDAHVVAEPAGPSRVGLFLASRGRGALPSELRPLDEDDVFFPAFVIPEGWTGRLDLEVGRPARRGEQYVRYSDAFAPGEPLHCSGLLGRSATAAAAHLPAAARGVRFQALGPGSSVPVDLTPADVGPSPFAHYVVAGAIAVSPTSVVVTVTPTGESPQPASAPTRGATCP